MPASYNQSLDEYCDLLKAMFVWENISAKKQSYLQEIARVMDKSQANLTLEYVQEHTRILQQELDQKLSEEKEPYTKWTQLLARNRAKLKQLYDELVGLESKTHPAKSTKKNYEISEILFSLNSEDYPDSLSSLSLEDLLTQIGHIEIVSIPQLEAQIKAIKETPEIDQWRDKIKVLLETKKTLYQKLGWTNKEYVAKIPKIEEELKQISQPNTSNIYNTLEVLIAYASELEEFLAQKKLLLTQDPVLKKREELIAQITQQCSLLKAIIIQIAEKLRQRGNHQEKDNWLAHLKTVSNNEKEALDNANTYDTAILTQISDAWRKRIEEYQQTLNQILQPQNPEPLKDRILRSMEESSDASAAKAFDNIQQDAKPPVEDSEKHSYFEELKQQLNTRVDLLTRLATLDPDNSKTYLEHQRAISSILSSNFVNLDFLALSRKNGLSQLISLHRITTLLSKNNITILKPGATFSEPVFVKDINLDLKGKLTAISFRKMIEKDSGSIDILIHNASVLAKENARRFSEEAATKATEIVSESNYRNNNRLT